MGLAWLKMHDELYACGDNMTCRINQLLKYCLEAVQLFIMYVVNNYHEKCTVKTGLKLSKWRGLDSLHSTGY